MQKMVWFLQVIIIAGYLYGQEPSQLLQAVQSIDGLSANEQQELYAVLQSKFQHIPDNQFQEHHINSIKAVIAAGLFDEVPYPIIADVSLVVYQAVERGAPQQYVEDLAEIGFSHSIAADQLEFAAKGRKILVDGNIDTYIVDDIIAYSIYNNWSGATIDAVCRGLLTGYQQQIDPQKLALYLIIAVDQADDKSEINKVVAKSIQELQATTAQKSVDENRKDAAFQVMKESIRKGVPGHIANEIFTNAVNEKWSPELIQAVFKGLEEGQNLGVSIEKLGTAFLIRVAQGLDNTTPQKMVKDELNYIKRLEKKKIDVIEKDKKEFKRQPQPIYRNQLGYTQPRQAKQTTPQTPPVTYFEGTQRNKLNETLMWQTIREYLGPPQTPYRWGGTTRYGIDCSGFSQAVYKQLGIYIPRVSRQQFRIGRAIAPNQLAFGDLIFFSKYFNDYITHVGIYIGNGNFVHSSSRKGVNISTLNKRYYRTRYRGARRVIYK